MSMVLDEFDQALLANGKNQGLDDAFEREVRKGWGPTRKYLKILGQGKPGKRPVIPAGNVEDPKAGVVVRFAAVRNHLESPAPMAQLEDPLGIYFIPAYVHWMEVLGDDGKEHWVKTICCGDAAEMDAGRIFLDPEKCPSCAWALENARQKGLTVEKFVTPGLPQLKRYFFIFNESAHNEDLKEWIDEGLEKGVQRDESQYVPTIWLLEVSSGPLLRAIRDQNRDPDFGPLTNYRVRMFWTPEGKNNQAKYHLKPLFNDVSNEHRYYPYSAAQKISQRQYNEGMEVDGEIVAIPDVRYDCYPWTPEDQKRKIYGSPQDAEKRVKREEEANAAFADNPVAAPTVRDHAPIASAVAPSSTAPKTARVSSPIAATPQAPDPFADEEKPTAPATPISIPAGIDFDDEPPAAPVITKAQRTSVGAMPAAAVGNVDF